VLAKINKTLEKFPQAGAGEPVRRALAMIDGDVWLAKGLYAWLKQDDALLRGIIDAIEEMPGVARVFTAEELAGQQNHGGPIVRAAAGNYVSGRSGDLFVVAKPYWIFGSKSVAEPQTYGTNHGSPYDYDQRVPVFLMGSGIKPGEYLLESSPADIAPTLAFLCGMTLARPDGRILREALAPLNVSPNHSVKVPAAKN
jgi:hypothetical protein